jgi:hypothetical protein
MLLAAGPLKLAFGLSGDVQIILRAALVGMT